MPATPVAFGTLTGTGALSASKPSFSGTFAGTTKSAFSGAFFGPQAEEFGYTFYAETPEFRSGGFVGGTKQGNGQDGSFNSTLANLSKDVRGFATADIYGNYVQDNTGNLISVEDDDDAPLDERLLLSYDAANNSYTLRNVANSTLTANIANLGTFGTAQLARTQPDARFATYSKSAAGGTVQLQLYKVGAANSEIALTYTSIGHLTLTRPASGSSNQRVFDDWFVYALPLSGGGAVQIPTSGTGLYKGVIYGVSVPADINGVAIAGATADVRGTSQFVFDFGTQKFTGYLEPILIARSGGGSEALARYSFNNGNLSALAAAGEHANSFQTSIIDLMPSSPGMPRGWVSGSLYGPNATEFGAVFNLWTNANAGHVAISGVTVGKKEP